MANRRPVLIVFEAMLLFGLLGGLLSLRDAQVPHIVTFAAIAINLLLQTATIFALRKQKRNEQLPAAEKTVVINRQRTILKATFIGAASLFLVLMVNVGLFVSHTYSIRTFAFIVLVAAFLFFVFLTVRFTQLNRSATATSRIDVVNPQQPGGVQ
jgi:hypothetical protein